MATGFVKISARSIDDPQSAGRSDDKGEQKKHHIEARKKAVWQLCTVGRDE